MGRKPKDDLKGFLFIADHLARHGKQPSFRAIADELDYASKRSVQLLLDRLEKAGRIVRDDAGKVSLVHQLDAITSERTVRVPILGQVPCGPPEEAVEDIQGHVNVSTAVAKPGGTYFILRAKGDSMDRVGISPGDMMLIRQQPTADTGDIVLALVNGEATVKRFRREGEFVVLLPESTNPENQPMIFDGDFRIQGKVVTRLPDPY